MIIFLIFLVSDASQEAQAILGRICIIRAMYQEATTHFTVAVAILFLLFMSHEKQESEWISNMTYLPPSSHPPLPPSLSLSLPLPLRHTGCLVIHC